MKINECYFDLLNNQSRILVLYGSAGSGKSVFAAQKLIYRIKTERNHKILALRKVAVTVKDSIFAELKNVIYTEGYENEFVINKTEKQITHTPTGNVILCKGLDEPEKIKSISGITAMWLEETTEFMDEDLRQLQTRIRGKKTNYIQYIYSFNPISEDNHVVNAFVVDDPPDNSTVLKTTYKDNKFLTQEDKDVLEAFKYTNEVFYQVYCLGNVGIVDKTNKFFYSFDQKYHVDHTEYDKTLPIKFSFDFNIDPFACLVYQADEHQMSILEEIRLGDSDIYQMCDTLKAKYPPHLYHYQVTGDRTGYNNTGVVRGKTSYWAIIKEELGLSQAQLRLRNKNLDLIESRVLCNAALKHKDIIVDPKCETLIRDLKYAEVDSKGVLVKDRLKNKNDFGDCARYAIDAEYPELSRKPKKF